MGTCGKILNQFHILKKDLNLQKYFITVLTQITKKMNVLRKTFIFQRKIIWMLLLLIQVSLFI
jgi:hypothetical protein